MSTLGVVVLAYGPPDAAAELTGRLVEEGLKTAAITVVHNGAAADAPWPGDPAIEVVRQDNRGYAGGMNTGVARREEDLVLLLTHDARFEPGALRRLVAAAAAHPEIGIFGPRLDDPVRGVTFSLGVRVGLTGGTHHLLEARAERGVIRCDAVDGAIMLVRREVFADAGPFDESLFMYFEETEFALRARRAGWGVACVPDAHAEQEGGEGRRPGVFAYLRIRNGYVFSRRAKGVLGVAGTAFRVAMYLVMYGRRVLDPRRSAASKDAARAAVAGVLAGARDALAGRMGPPPQLPGMGDVEVSA